MFVCVSVSIDIGREISGTLMCGLCVVVVVIQPNSSCCMPCFWHRKWWQWGLMLEDMFFVPNLTLIRAQNTFQKYVFITDTT